MHIDYPALFVMDFAPFIDSLSSIGIELCAWRECTGHTALVLVCNNGEFFEILSYLNLIIILWVSSIM